MRARTALALAATLVLTIPGGASADPEEQITDVAGDAHGGGWHHQGDGGGLVRSTYNFGTIFSEYVEDMRSIVGDPNAHGTPVEPVSVPAADVVGVALTTPYVAVPQGNGIDYRPTGLGVRIRTSAVPRVAGQELTYILRGFARTPDLISHCKIRLYLTSRADGGLVGSFDVGDSPDVREEACPTAADAGITLDPSSIRVTSSPPAIEVVIPSASLPAASAAFLAEEAVLEEARVWASVPSDTRHTTSGALDKTGPSSFFVVGADTPYDVPCTSGC